MGSTMCVATSPPATPTGSVQQHVASDKFAGFDPDGSRRDWITVADVYGWLSHITATGA
jgi:hypothetical protein